MAFSVKQAAAHQNITVSEIAVDDITVYGTEVKMADLNSYVLMIDCAHGNLYCGIYDVNVMNKMNAAGCVFRGVPHLEDILKSNPKEISDKAASMGVTKEMTGEEIVRIFSR